MAEDFQLPVPLTSVRDDMSAAVIVSTLKDEGIEAVATGGFTTGLWPLSPGDVQIMVKRQDLKRAQELIDAVQPDQVDWSQLDVGQPEDEEE